MNIAGPPSPHWRKAPNCSARKTTLRVSFHSPLTTKVHGGARGKQDPASAGLESEGHVQTSLKSVLKQEAGGAGLVPSGLPGHPAPQNWTPDGRVTTAGYQPRAPRTAGSERSPTAPRTAPPGRPRGDANLGGASSLPGFPEVPPSWLGDTGSGASGSMAPPPATLNYRSGWGPSLIRCD